MDTPKRRQQSRRRRRNVGHQSDASSSHQFDNAPAATVPDIPFQTAAATPDSDASPTLAADRALVTQFPRAAPLEERAGAIVVTVTQTQTDTGVNTGGDDLTTQGTSIPIGIIIGSVAVGVVLACAVVGGWVWWGKRLKSQGHYYGRNGRPSHMKNQTSTSSTARLKPASASSPTSPRHEKSNHHYPTTTPPRQSDRSRQHQSQRKPHAAGGVAAAAGIPGAGSAVSTPVNKTRAPPQPNKTSPTKTSPTTSEAPSSPASTLVGNDDSPAKPTLGIKTYVPQKPSPLAQGVERAKIKPQEKPKVNEWATPVSPTKSSSHGHGTGFEGTRSTSDHDLNDTKAHLAVPEPAAIADPRKDRISVLSGDSYYAPGTAEDDDGDYYVGVALGGDDPSPSYEGYPPRQAVNEADNHYFSEQHYHPNQHGWGR